MPEKISCSGGNYDEKMKQDFDVVFGRSLENSEIVWSDKGVLRMKVNATIQVVEAPGKFDVAARYDKNEDLVVDKEKEVKPVKPFYRVGTTYVGIDANPLSHF